jgi:hypothetical protein
MGMHNTGGRTRAGAPKKHESVEALLAFHNERKPKPLIQRLARERVAYAKSMGWFGPPYCPKILASILGIRCRLVQHDIGGDGRILPYRDGKLWIEYRDNPFPERQRFTIFHELAHTLFPDFCHFLPKHHKPGVKLKDPEQEFESLCDAGAAEMLLPLEDFTTDLAGHDIFNFKAIHSLRKRYEASIDATTHRFIDLVDVVPCAAAFFTDQRQASFGPGHLWVQYSKKSTEFKSYLAPGTTPPRNSVVFECFRTGLETTQSAKETWWINGSPRTWLVQATKLPAFANPNYAKVLALFFPSSYR